MSELNINSDEFIPNLTPAAVILLKCVYTNNKVFYNEFCKKYADHLETIFQKLEREMYIKLLGDDYEFEDVVLRDKTIKLFESNKITSFADFWDKYHTITDLPKTDKESAKKYWKRLSKVEQLKAVANIKSYYDSLSDSRYCKKARTYLADKNFNDEFRTRRQSEEDEGLFSLGTKA